MAVDPVFQASSEISKMTSYYMYEQCLDSTRFTLIFDSQSDRDINWEQFTQRYKEKEYEDDTTLFEGDGEEVNTDV